MFPAHALCSPSLATPLGGSTVTPGLEQLAGSWGPFALSSLPSPQMDGRTERLPGCTPLVPPHCPAQSNGPRLWLFIIF